MDALPVLGEIRERLDSELTPLFFALEDYTERRLWHQLTETLFEIFKDARSAGQRMALFEQFIVRFKEQMNPLAFVTFAVYASEECATPAQALEFMSGVAAQFDKPELRAVHVFAELRISGLHIEQGNTVPAKKGLDHARSVIESEPITDSVILAQFYGVSSEFYKKHAEYSAYYRTALLYLAVVSADSIPADLRRQRAQDLCISALLGDTIYNFGELVLHPILDALAGEDAWLRDLVLVINRGDVPEFQKLRPTFTANSELLANALPFLEQKLCLMALCECVFRFQGIEYSLPFSVIAEETFLQPGTKVEILVMKAMSLGLMKGTIDEVDQTISITWLQPRVLSGPQMTDMRNRVVEWENEVSDLGDWISEEGSSVWQVA